AVRTFEAADVETTTDRRAYAEALLAAGRPADAERLFRRVVRESPGVAARVGLARTLKALGNEAAAESVYADAVRALPSYGPAAMELAELRWRRGHRDAALQGLVSFLELDPRHVDGLVLLGTWLYETDRSVQAVRALERAVRLDPTHRRAADELARLRGGD
ncbi:MAG: tetratricopeptide repeat protein, partial [Longimicrobiales bacterium]|nr:tetratricopeptide repeat protein [Longimicrobiales bacterium]